MRRRGGSLDQACAFQSRKGAILIDSLQRSSGQLYPNVAPQFRHPNAFATQIWRKGPLHPFDMVQPNAAFLFSEAAVVNSIALLAPGTCDAANPCHNGGISNAVSPTVKKLSVIPVNVTFRIEVHRFPPVLPAPTGQDSTRPRAQGIDRGK